MGKFTISRFVISRFECTFVLQTQKDPRHLTNATTSKEEAPLYEHTNDILAGNMTGQNMPKWHQTPTTTTTTTKY